MECTDVNEVLQKIAEARRMRKESIKGIERMQYNLLLKLRGWMLRNDNERCVCVGEVVDRVMHHAPKAIWKSRDAVIEAVENLWRVTHSFSIASVEWLREDLDDELKFHFN
jgi:hypothetical protein